MVHDWNKFERERFSNLDVFVSIPGVTPAGSAAGPLIAKDVEKHEQQIQLRDSYGRDDADALPFYKSLYYDLIDISVTDEATGLGYGALTNY